MRTLSCLLLVLAGCSDPEPGCGDARCTDAGGDPANADVSRDAGEEPSDDASEDARPIDVPFETARLTGTITVGLDVVGFDVDPGGGIFLVGVHADEGLIARCYVPLGSPGAESSQPFGVDGVIAAIEVAASSDADVAYVALQLRETSGQRTHVYRVAERCGRIDELDAPRLSDEAIAEGQPVLAAIGRDSAVVAFTGHTVGGIPDGIFVARYDGPAVHRETIAPSECDPFRGVSVAGSLVGTLAIVGCTTPAVEGRIYQLTETVFAPVDMRPGALLGVATVGEGAIVGVRDSTLTIYTRMGTFSPAFTFSGTFSGFVAQGRSAAWVGTTPNGAVRVLATGVDSGTTLDPPFVVDDSGGFYRATIAGGIERYGSD